MFDQNYFQTAFLRDVAAAGGHPIVEVQLTSGHAHRVRSVVDAGSGTVTFETYLTKGDLAHERPQFGMEGSGAGERDTFRAVIAYEAIAAVVLDPTPSHVRGRPGFVTN